MNFLVPLNLKILYNDLHIQSPEKYQRKMCQMIFWHSKLKLHFPIIIILPDYVAFLFGLFNWEKLTIFDVTGCILFLNILKLKKSIADDFNSYCKLFIVYWKQADLKMFILQYNSKTWAQNQNVIWFY